MSITSKGRNKWRVRVSNGFDPITGKRREYERIVNGTKAEARKKEAELRREIEGGLELSNDQTTILDFLPVWSDSKRTKGNATERTIRESEKRIKKIVAIIGDLKLKKLNAQLLEIAYAKLKEQGLSGTTINHIHSDMKAMLKKACAYDLLLKNPADRVDPPKRNKPDRKAISAKETARLLQCLNQAELEAYNALEQKENRQEQRGNTKDRSFIRDIRPLSCVMATKTILATGMRRGEVCALTWGCMGLKCDRLEVKGSITYQCEYKDPKTAASVRSIALDANTARHLRDWKRQQARYLNKIGLIQNANTPVFCNSVGTWLDPTRLSNWWKHFRHENNFPGLKLHELRHTQATLLLANGVDVKTVQNRLGHANASITLDWYAHPIPEKDEQAATILGSLMQPQTLITPVKTA